MPEISQLLSRLGLGDKETKVFLSLVKLGPSTVSEIADEAKITRTHVYELAESLKQKGLLTQMETKGVRRYEALDHTGLLAYLSHKQKELHELEKSFAVSANQFNALRKGGKLKTKVRFFEGTKGVEAIYHEIKRDLKSQPPGYEVLTIFSPSRVETLIPGWLQMELYIDEPGMKKRGIVADTAFTQHYLEKMRSSKNAHSYKIWPKGKDEFPTDTIYWLNKITLIDLIDYPSGIIIEDAAIVQSFKMWFEFIWHHLPSTNPQE